MRTIDYNFSKSIQVLNHIKSDSRFLIDQNRLFSIQSDFFHEIDYNLRKSIEIVNLIKSIQDFQSIRIDYLLFNQIYL
jgi:hypothetical protein